MISSQIALLLSLATIVGSHLAAEMPAEFQKRDSCPPADEQEVEACLRPMLDYATTLQNNGLLPLEGAQVFRKLCELYSDFTHCAEQIACRSISMEAMDASYGYMCGQGYYLFSKHVDCFAEVENQQKYLKCKNTATAGVNQLHFDSGYPSDYFNTLCTVMQTYLHCSRPIILSKCGPEAWNLVTRVTKDSLQVTMPGCNLKPSLFDENNEEQE